MSDDPIRKVFTRQRIEYWVPTGEYSPGNDGADWHELMKAIAWATNALAGAGMIPDGWKEAGRGQISVLPHDEHVIVRFYLEEEAQSV